MGFLLTVILWCRQGFWYHGYTDDAPPKSGILTCLLGAPYFNSGVMIMDLAAFRKEGYGEKVLQCVTSHAYRHHDQDGLNKVFMGNWSILPLRWNVIPPVFGMPLKVLKKVGWWLGKQSRPCKTRPSSTGQGAITVGISRYRSILTACHYDVLKRRLLRRTCHSPGI